MYLQSIYVQLSGVIHGFVLLMYVFIFLFRWDSQRIREQRQYEKLRARYEGEDRSQDRCSSSTRNGRDATTTTTAAVAATVSSLWQSAEDVSHLQVEPWLPVSIFGAPLPNIAQSYVAFCSINGVSFSSSFLSFSSFCSFSVSSLFFKLKLVKVLPFIFLHSFVDISAMNCINLYCFIYYRFFFRDIYLSN